MDEGSSVRANEQEAGRCLFRAHGGDIGIGVSLLAGKGALIPGWLRNRVDGKWSTIDKALSSPWSLMCPHWCHCLGSSSLSYPTGLTKPKRDWLYCSSFLCKPRSADQSCRFQEWWSCVYITVNHYSTGIFSEVQMSRSIAHNHLRECRNCKEWISHIATDSMLLTFLTHFCVPPLCTPPSFVFRAHAKQLLNTSTCVHVLHQKLTQMHANAHAPLIRTEKLLCGIQSQCSWLESLFTASDVTSACSVSCSSPAPFLFPTLFHQLNPSFDTSEGVPHMHVTSPPPPPVLSSWLSIESTHHRLKVVYFVELTLWCLHHLEVGKWYWVERLIFMVESEKSSETFFFFHSCCVADRQTLRFGWRGRRKRRKGVDGVTFELAFSCNFEWYSVQRCKARDSRFSSLLKSLCLNAILPSFIFIHLSMKLPHYSALRTRMYARTHSLCATSLISFLQILRLIMYISSGGQIVLLWKHNTRWLLLSFAVPVYLRYRNRCLWKVSLAYRYVR